MTDWVLRLEALCREGTKVAVVTVVAVSGSAPREPGAKMLVLADGSIHGTIGGGQLELLAISDARAALADGRPRQVRYPLGAKAGQCCGGVVDLFLEPVNHGPRLYVFGAGHVGQAVANALVGTPFTVHLVDEREAWVNSSEVRAGVRRHCVEWDDFAREARWDAALTYAAVMTHRHDLDQQIIAWAVEQPAKYLGLIGSEAKWRQFRRRLLARGVAPARLDRVHCPIGLPLGGGKAPQEVAISVAAELLRIHHAAVAATTSRAPSEPLSAAPAEAPVRSS